MQMSQEASAQILFTRKGNELEMTRSGKSGVKIFMVSLCSPTFAYLDRKRWYTQAPHPLGTNFE